MRVKRDPVFLAAVGERLAKTTAALQLLDGEMAKRAGVTKSAWSNYIHGIRPLDLDAAIRLCERTKITLDWIYRGDLSGVARELADKIDPPSNNKTTVITLNKRR